MLEYEGLYVANIATVTLQQMHSVIPVGGTSLGRYIGSRVVTVLGKWFESDRSKETMP